MGAACVLLLLLHEFASAISYISQRTKGVWRVYIMIAPIRMYTVFAYSSVTWAKNDSSFLAHFRAFLK